MGYYANSADFVASTGIATTVTAIGGPLYGQTFFEHCVTTSSAIRIIPITSAVNSQGTI